MVRLTPLGIREQVITYFVVGFALLFCLLGALYYSPYLGFFAVFPLGLLWLVLNFFRDPERLIPSGENLIVSPADGTVTHVDEVDDPGFIGGKALRVSIFLSIFNVHINRAPCAGTVAYRKYKKGQFVTAMRADSSHLNEMMDFGLTTPDPRVPKVLVRQIAGIAARRIVCELPEGTALARGERYGMIKFGSRTEIFLPVASQVSWRVKPGDKVQGGATVLGELPS